MTHYKLINYPVMMPLSKLYDKLSSNQKLNQQNIHKENPAIPYKNYLYFKIR